MGLILDSSVLIADERRGETVKRVIQRVHTTHGDQESALSAMSIIELTHGIYRAKTDTDRTRRRAFTEELVRDMIASGFAGNRPTGRTHRRRAGPRCLHRC